MSLTGHRPRLLLCPLGAHHKDVRWRRELRGALTRARHCMHTSSYECGDSYRDSTSSPLSPTPAVMHQPSGAYASTHLLYTYICLAVILMTSCDSYRTRIWDPCRSTSPAKNGYTRFPVENRPLRGHAWCCAQLLRSALPACTLLNCECVHEPIPS